MSGLRTLPHFFFLTSVLVISGSSDFTSVSVFSVFSDLIFVAAFSDLIFVAAISIFSSGLSDFLITENELLGFHLIVTVIGLPFDCKGLDSYSPLLKWSLTCALYFSNSIFLSSYFCCLEALLFPSVI